MQYETNTHRYTQINLRTVKWSQCDKCRLDGARITELERRRI